MIRGIIVAYSNDVNAGVIKAGDGKKYYFTKSEWSSSAVNPARNLAVAFIPALSKALKVKVAA
jgi:hypothetical protein